MDPSHILAASGCAGVVFGSLASVAATPIAQQAQHGEADRTRRTELFESFITEPARQYAEALSHEKDDVRDLVQLYALVAKLRLFAPRPIVTAAERVLDVIVNSYLGPNKLAPT